MRAADVMTIDVVTVAPNDLLQDVAKVLLQHRISGAPVVDQLGNIVGVISEGDLMRRAETGTDEQRSWWLSAIAGRDRMAIDYVRSHARKVADVMTTGVVTARPDTSLREIASLMERKRIKRVPIVEGGKLVGIISRANLLQAFASMHVPAPAPATAGDKEIRQRVFDRLKAESWASLSSLNIIVQQGSVELWGAVASEAEHRAIRIAAETTPGVASVKDHLMVGTLVSGT